MTEFNLNYENFDCTSENAGARWIEWIEDFEIFLSACNITNKARRRAALLHCGGKELRRTYNTMKDENDEYDDIRGKLTKHFEPQRNKRFERLKFRQAKQEADETVDAFVSRLKHLSLYCEFNDVDDQILDQLAIYCQSITLRKKILERNDIALDKVLEHARTIEAVELHMKEIDQSHGNESSGKFEKTAYEVNAISDRVCSFCKLVHRSNECPAKHRRCNSCGIKGHFSRCCPHPTKKLRSVYADEQDDDSDY